MKDHPNGTQRATPPRADGRPGSEAGAPGRDSNPADELLILDDGRVLVHHLSPALAELLSRLNPADAAMKQRAVGCTGARPPSIRGALHPAGQADEPASRD
ncbi:MAG: hypothetical protein KGS61_05090 [Verrucomicrobia bacterium]|nr:hypothetical protein [Verrucomicrobiota bacterium]